MALDLPFVALIDTSVFALRLGHKPTDPNAAACVDFCDRMARSGSRRLFVAAPTITEVTRYKGKEVPLVPGISVVAFDERAATLLGMKLPALALAEWRDDLPARTVACLKYDALIVGCALRIPNCAFVSMDKGQLALATRVGLAAHHPSDYFTPPGTTSPQPGQLLLP